jgi:hypothetical protein
MGDRQAGAAIALNKRGSLMDPAAATLSSSRCDCLADVRDGVLSNVGCAPTGRRRTVSSPLHCPGSLRPWGAGLPRDLTYSPWFTPKNRSVLEQIAARAIRQGRAA